VLSPFVGKRPEAICPHKQPCWTPSLARGTVALKPDPVPRLLSLDRLKLSPIRCLFVGDSQVDA
jgi:hypothetical protein